jgi:outer membrane protein insertion porin family
VKLRALHIILPAWIALLMSGCSISKFMPSDDLLYRGSEVYFENPAVVSNHKLLANETEAKLHPVPNKKFLGLSYTRIWFYYKVNPNPEREKGLRHWLKNKIGEKPVLISDVDTELMTRIIDKNMQDNGYFNTRTIHDVIEKQKTAKIKYLTYHGNQIKIESVILPNTGSEIDSLFKIYPNYKTKPGNSYHLSDIVADRTGLAVSIRSQGYFDFAEQDIYFVVDTSLQNDKVNIVIRVKPPAAGELHKKYYVSEVNIFPTHELLASDNDTTAYLQSFSYRDYNIFQNYKFIGKRSLYNNVIVEPGSRFSVKEHQYTSERLVNLDVFKFVDINYSKNENDSLTVDIKLTPGQYQSVRADIEANTSNRSFLGSLVALSYSNKNLAGGAENLTLKASAGTEFQVINSKAALNIINVNFEVSFAIPRLLTFIKTRKVKSGNTPQTILSLQENYQRWLEYYTLNSVNFNFGYNWRTQKKHHHILNPFFVNVVSLLNTTDAFDELIDNNPLLKIGFDNSVIMGYNYMFSLTTQKNPTDRSYIYFSAYAESAGNENYLIAKMAGKDEMPYKVFNTPFAQYAKVDVEFRHYLNFKRGSSLVSRFAPGVGAAYGNSIVMPYIKQFYMGGPNTLRAFPFRSIGPGRFSSLSDSESGVVNPIEQAGDIKLMLNLEYRYKIYKFVKGALFVDMGNVWLRNEDPARPESGFVWNEFYKQLAIGTGAGIRLDFDFFVLRTDVGIPLHKPFSPEGERWIHQFSYPDFKSWRRDNLVWNIAIGYPF